MTEKPKTATEIQGLIENEVIRITVLTAEQRYKDQVYGWNKCWKEIYRFLEKRIYKRDLEEIKRFEIKGVGAVEDSSRADFPTETKTDARSI